MSLRNPVGENGDCYTRVPLELDALRRACADGVTPRAQCQ